MARGLCVRHGIWHAEYGQSHPPAMPGAGYQIAFKANTGNLWIDFNGNGIDQHLGMN